MIIVTVRRAHSETINNQTIKSDQSDDIWRQDQFHFTSVNKKWIIFTFFFFLNRSEWHRVRVRFFDTSMRIRSQTMTDSLSWLNPKWIDPQTYQWQERTKSFNIFSLFFCVFFLSFFFLLSLVDMLNPCVLQVCGQSKRKVLSEPLLALGVRGVDGGVLSFRRAEGGRGVKK